ncbi:LamG domain-containing protein [Paenibacillus profundus]|uniref:LamG domain-containing protein n=1 Tax=Paenibacillus profundus TaxID=1173085 RepID=A0ABS8YGM9_9BACL|nr:LamG domain-containing protein [Paenibacillus profundus]MCE5169643.1 LamG domain-containing protein [Paenibacillus profundus]
MSSTLDNMNRCGVGWFKMDEASGNAIDSKGNAIGTPSNVKRISDKDRNSIEFNGVNSYVQFNQRIIPIGNKSIRFKIKPYPTSSIKAILQTGGYNNTGIRIDQDTDNKIMVIAQNTTNILATAKSLDSLVVGEWNDVLVIFSSQKILIYVNSFTKHSITELIGLELEPTNNLIVGKTIVNYSERYFKGQICELEIYNDIISPIPNKILIYHGNQYKTYNESWQNIGTSVVENDYIFKGVDDISTIPEAAWAELKGDVELCYYTDALNKTEVSFNIETEPFTLAEEFDGQTIKIIEYTDNPTQEESIITLETEPFTFYDEVGDSFDVLHYTDDPDKTEAELEINHNYSPWDELDGDFELVTWTMEEETEVQEELKPIFKEKIEDGDLYGVTVDLSKGTINIK